MTRAEHIEQVSLEAFRAFEKHHVISLEATRWKIAQPHPSGGFNSIYFAEINVVSGGLLVHGDINHILFMNNNEPARIGWIGSRPRVCGYVEEKASIGMGSGCSKAVRGFNYEVFRSEVTSLVDALDTADHNETYAEHLDLLLGTSCDDSDTESYIDELCSEAGCDESCSGLGTVPSTRLIYAHAAVHRLYLLLGMGKGTP